LPGSSTNRAPPRRRRETPSHDYPQLATQPDIASQRYVEEEYFFEGTATRYSTPPLATGGVVSTGHPYKTRMIVRRPASAERFNGIVVVEWVNVTAGRNPVGVNPLGGLPVRMVIASGVLQSEGRLVAYHNSIHPLAGVYDGFFLELGIGGQLRTDRNPRRRRPGHASGRQGWGTGRSQGRATSLDGPRPSRPVAPEHRFPSKAKLQLPQLWSGLE
jgi:hypothetical protein